MEPLFSKHNGILKVEGKNLSPLDRMINFLGHYDLRIYVTDTAYLDVGRGSLAAALRLTEILPGTVGCLGKVGQWCDFAECKILGGGEHQNDQPVNVMFPGAGLFLSYIQHNNIRSLSTRPHEPFSIGNAVVVSLDAKILGGTSIGDGAVIGAGALVTGSVEPFSIYGGVPAKKIKDRVDASTKEAIQSVRWWDFDTVYLGDNLHRLQEIAVDKSTQHIYRKPSPRFILRMSGAVSAKAGEIKVLGFVDGDQQRPISEAPSKVIDYIKQIGGDPPYQWIANVWE